MIVNGLMRYLKSLGLDVGIWDFKIEVGLDGEDGNFYIIEIGYYIFK